MEKRSRKSRNSHFFLSLACSALSLSHSQFMEFSDWKHLIGISFIPHNYRKCFSFIAIMMPFIRNIAQAKNTLANDFYMKRIRVLRCTLLTICSLWMQQRKMVKNLLFTEIKYIIDEDDFKSCFVYDGDHKNLHLCLYQNVAHCNHSFIYIHILCSS